MYRCEICNKEFLSYHSLNGHKASHKLQYKFSCPKCDKKFFYEFQYIKHIKKCQYGEKLVFKCDICEKEFNSKLSLAIHKRNHSSKTYECNTCKRIFQRKGPYLKHIKSCVVKKGEFKCDNCNKEYKMKEAYEKHIQFCSSKKNKLFTRTEENKVFKCTKCERIFKIEYYFKNHTCKPKFKCSKKCPKCKRKFQYLKPYQRHIENCNQNHHKTYKCSICNKEFKNSAALAGHIGIVHSEKSMNKVKEFKCPICNKIMLTTKGAFKSHIQHHDNEFKANKGKKISETWKKIYNSERGDKIKKQRSKKMLIDNPMFKKETIEKMKESRRKYFDSLSDEEYSKIVLNFINAPKKGNAVNHSGKFTPTKIEQMIIDLNIEGLEYNGNKKGSKTIRFKNKNYKHSLTPDFIYKNSNKIIETFGVYWHSKEDEEIYKKACEENGYEILILWEDELYNNFEECKERIYNFLNIKKKD